jgi:glycosyltransferase involved in cell wall biosynthesis
MLVSIIVPAYNQEKTIKRDLRNIHDAMKKTRWDFELLVVNDGSTDRTLTEAKKVKRNNIQVYGYKKNYGKGYAVKYGMARAKGDLIAFIDSGMDIDPNGISLLLEHMIWYDSDVIVASKRHSASKVNYTFLRKLYSQAYYYLVKLLFNLRVRDTQAGLKIYKRQVLEKVMPRMLIKTFAFDIELLAVAQHLGFTNIHEGPVQLTLKFGYNSKWKKNLLFLDPQILKMLKDTLAVFYRLKILRYYDDGNKRQWVYNKELDMRINTGQ